MAPGHRGPLEHLHTGHDEAFFMLSGALRFRVGSDHRQLTTGETVFASRGLAHGFSNEGTEPARYLAMLSPSGYEFYFERLAAPDPRARLDAGPRRRLAAHGGARDVPCGAGGGARRLNADLG